MPLTGIGDDPTPAIRREIVFSQGDSLGAGSEDYVLFLGNKTSAGSETVELLGTRILSDQDMRDRVGARSELYQEYRTFTMVDTEATCFFIAVTEAAAGAAGTCTFTFAGGAASDATTLDITWGGFSTSIGVSSGDTAIVQAAAFAAAVLSADSGSWPFTAAIGGGGSEHIVTVTSANIGDRATLTLSRILATYRKSATTTCTKSAVTNGTNTDDFTTAYATAANAGVFTYQVSAKHATSAPTSTDNGIGEHAASITTQFLPINGKDQFAIFGLVGTSAQQVTVCTAVNNPLCYFYWAENNPWSPGMLAAHHAAVMRVQQTKHPSANLTDYTNNATKGTIYNVPAPAVKTDIPTAAEIKAALNSGGSPVTFSALGAPRLVRQVTSYSLLSGTAVNDFRCREGHIPNAIRTYWRALYTGRLAKKQAFLSRVDPPAGTKPLPNTDYPQTIKAEAMALIDDFTSAKPLNRYEGPILDPATAAEMKASISTGTTANGGGGLTLQVNLSAVVHNNTYEAKINEVSAPQ